MVPAEIYPVPTRGCNIPIANIAHVLLPAISVTSSVYIPSHVMISQPVYGCPLSVAVTHGLLSVKIIITPVEYSIQLSTPVKVGGSLSIRHTSAMAIHVFPRRS